MRGVTRSIEGAHQWSSDRRVILDYEQHCHLLTLPVPDARI
jgi:hypothetical protein